MRTILLILAGLVFALPTARAQNTLHILPGTHWTLSNGTHVVLHDCNLKNDGVFAPGQSTVHFTGSGADSLLGTASTGFYDLLVNVPNFYIPPELPCPWSHNIIFSGNAGRIILGGNELRAGATAEIIGADANHFIVTTNNARVVKENLSGFTFPVGPDTERFTPLTIVQSGQPITLSVACRPQVLANGLSGNPYYEGVVNASWQLSGIQPGAANLALTAQWNASDELINFDGADCGIAKSLGAADWDLASPFIGSKTGQGPFTVSRTGILSDGVFAVGSAPLMYPIRIQLKVFLQGAYKGTTGMMDDNLRLAQQLPVAEPYSDMPGFNHVGRGGGEHTTSTVLNVSGPNAVVDWVFLELRKGSSGNSAVLETRAALIQRDGDITDVDGVSPVVFRGQPAGNYFLAVRHRNHLAVRSALTLSLSKNLLYYDFTEDAYRALYGVQAPLGDNTRWGMYAGNANSDGRIDYLGTASDHYRLLYTELEGVKQNVLLPVYLNADLDLNGSVRYSGPFNDQNLLLNKVLGGNKTNTIVQPDF